MRLNIAIPGPVVPGLEREIRELVEQRVSAYERRTPSEAWLYDENLAGEEGYLVLTETIEKRAKTPMLAHPKARRTA